MKIGVVFPQTEIGANPDTVAVFANTAETLGFDHIVAYDHVLGASTATRPDWQGPYTDKSMFHEPFVLFGYLAGLTETIGLVTAVIILPQRQTALVAKQAACLDVLSGGRLRLGVGTGWNAVEYEALGENFHNRGVRSEEQIDLMRKLWANEVVDYDGEWHRVDSAGLNPLPAARSIPVWLGGMAEPVIDRVGRLADGWFPFFNPALGDQIERMKSVAREHDRNPADIGIQVMVRLESSAERQRDQLKRLEDMGVTHSAIVTMNQDLASPNAHVDAISRFRDSVQDLM